LSGQATRANTAAGDRIWTERAAGYGWNVDATLSSRLKAELVRDHVSPQSRVCDVGCGNGLFLRVLAPHCAHVTGIDLNAGMLAEARAMAAREDLGNVDLIQASGDALTLLLIPDVDAALAHMVRILRPGGRLILDVAGRNNLSAIYWRLWYRRQGHFGIHAFTYPAIEAKLEKLGCRILASHALGFCDQWKYVPGLHLLRRLDGFFHGEPARERNLDYRVSNLPGIFRLANRWYIVARKEVGT
jgi:SAM-dependent methyltransferase